MKQIETYPGMRISGACVDAVAVAGLHPLRVIGFKFNGVVVKTAAQENPDDLMNFYWRTTKERAEAYERSTEGIEAAKIARESIKEGLHRFQRKDEKAWTAWKVANLDGGYTVSSCEPGTI